MPKGLRIEHRCGIIPALNLPVFMFVYIHVNVPPTRITDFLEMYQMERYIDTEQSPLSMFLLLSN